MGLPVSRTAGPTEVPVSSQCSMIISDTNGKGTLLREAREGCLQGFTCLSDLELLSASFSQLWALEKQRAKESYRVDSTG